MRTFGQSPSTSFTLFAPPPRSFRAGRTKSIVERRFPKPAIFASSQNESKSVEFKSLAEVDEEKDSALSAKRDEFAEEIAKAKRDSVERKIFDDKNANDDNKSDGAVKQRRNDENEDEGEDEPLRIFGSAPVNKGENEPKYSKQLSKTVRALVPEGASASTVLRTTKRFMEAYEAGLPLEEQVAFALGVPVDKLNSIQKKYAPLAAEKLEENAKQLKGELLAVTKLYDAGIHAYSVGRYPESLKLFEQALEETSETSLMGGRILIYQCLSLYALRRIKDCIKLYTYIENTHPVPKIRKQVEELKYIAEAPRLELGEDEYVDVPAGVRDGDVYRRGYGKATRSAVKPKVPKTYTEEALERVNYAKYKPNRLQLVGWSAIAICLAVYGAHISS